MVAGRPEMAPWFTWWLPFLATTGGAALNAHRHHLEAALAAHRNQPTVNATVRLRSADTTYGSCHTLPLPLPYGN